MKDVLKNEFLRLGMRVIGKKSPNAFKRENQKIVIPTVMNSLVETITHCDHKLYYDKWNDGYPTVELSVCCVDDCIEYTCLETKPYFSIMTDGDYSYYLLMADDENPEDPAVYFIDHDDFNEEDAYKVAPSLSEFLRALKTRKEANSIIRDPELELDIEEIGILVNLSECPIEQVKHLRAQGCEIESLRKLSNYPNIKSLNLVNNSISNINELDSMKNLEEVNLSKNKIRDIYPLSDKTLVWDLNLSYNSIESIEALKNLTKLKHLNLSNNLIKDICVLSNLSSLTFLNLSDNKIKDISCLKDNKSLVSIDLEDNLVEDISVLSTIPTLETVRLHGNPVKNMEVLKSLPKLKIK